MTETIDPRKLAGNWKRFENFSPGPILPHLKDGDNWAVVFTHGTDAEPLEQSNADAVAKRFKPFLESGDAFEYNAHHWLGPAVYGYAFRVFEPNHETTAVCEEWADICDALDKYPILDENDYDSRVDREGKDA